MDRSTPTKGRPLPHQSDKLLPETRRILRMPARIRKAKAETFSRAALEEAFLTFRTSMSFESRATGTFF